jgi:hypothetical protein
MCASDLSGFLMSDRLQQAAEKLILTSVAVTDIEV